MKISIFLPLILATITGCSTLLKTPKPIGLPVGAEAIDAYASVLDRFVNDRGEVDFPALERQRRELDAYIEYVANTPASHFRQRNERLAHYINSYNALSMYNVLASGIPKTHAGLAKVRFFYLRKLNIGGIEMSLYDYENEVIRPLKEPRIHFALNCSALSCPTLPRKPFAAANLEKQLELETRKFFSESRNLRIDHKQRKVFISELLDFYSEDFISPQTPSLIAFINRYRTDSIPEDYAVEFLPYDWTIANSRR